MESNLAMGWEVVTTMIEVVVTTMATVMALVVEMVVVMEVVMEIMEVMFLMVIDSSYLIYTLVQD
jgi:hypothetical protein